MTAKPGPVFEVSIIPSQTAEGVVSVVLFVRVISQKEQARETSALMNKTKSNQDGCIWVMIDTRWLRRVTSSMKPLHSQAVLQAFREVKR